MRMVDGYIEAKCLEENVFIAHQFLCLCQVLFGLSLQLWLISVKTNVGNLDNMLQLSRLLLHLSSQEKCSSRDIVSVELGEAVKHIEPLHVHNRGIDA